MATLSQVSGAAHAASSSKGLLQPKSHVQATLAAVNGGADFNEIHVAMQSHSGDLPKMMLKSLNYIDGKEVTLSLAPESDITTFELAKIMQMLFVYQINAYVFNPLEYVKANNLERHFTYS